MAGKKPMSKDKIVVSGEKGQKPIVMEKGGLHRSVGVPMGEKIPASKMKAAMAGEYGPKAKKQALARKNILTGPKKG